MPSALARAASFGGRPSDLMHLFYKEKKLSTKQKAKTVWVCGKPVLHRQSSCKKRVLSRFPKIIKGKREWEAAKSGFLHLEFTKSDLRYLSAKDAAR